MTYLLNTHIYTFKIYLSNHPITGMLAVFLGTLLPFVAWMTPLLQFAGLLFGVLIGFLTLAAKVEEFIIRFKRGKQKHERS